MTRETKVGMAVACSFLSLVVAVVVLRMRHGDEPDPSAAGSGLVAQGKKDATLGTNSSATVVRPAAGKPAPDKEPGVLPAVFNSSGDPLPVADPPGPPAGRQGILTPAAPTAAVKDVLPGVPSLPGAVQPEVSPPPIPAGRSPEVSPPPVVPPPAIPAPISPPAVSPPGAGAVASVPAPPTSVDLNKLPTLPGAEPNPPPVKPKEPVTPPAVAAAPVDPGLPGLPPPPTASTVPPAPPGAVAQNKKLSPEEEQQQRLKELMNQVAASGQADGPPAPGPRPATTVPVPAPGSGPEKGPLAQGKDLLPPPAPAPLPGPASTTKVEPPPGGSPLVPPAAAVVKDPGPGAPAAVKPPEVALNGQLTPMDPPGTGATRLPGTARPGDAPAAVAMGPITADDAPPGSRSPQASSAPTGGPPAPPPPAPASLPGNSPAPLPPLGAPPAGSSAPIAVPVPPPQPAGGPAKVQSYEVETHRVQPGDSTFADLSKKLYGSDKYAQALLQFNREYPLAGDNLKADPPRLEPGQPIYVPPTHILEQPRYAAVPPPARPIASTPSPVSVGVPPPVAVAPPRLPVAPAVPAVASTGPAPTAPSAAGTRAYTVQGNGEMLFEIARQTLGDGRRWSEIYRLNPDIRPELVIPGGTQLRLPADARVGS